jgi:hypothetical protein
MDKAGIEQFLSPLDVYDIERSLPGAGIATRTAAGVVG